MIEMTPRRAVLVVVLATAVLSACTSGGMSQTTTPSVSQARQTVVVPELRGLSAEQAEAMLMDVGLSIDAKTVTGDYVIGVIKQNPLPGTILQMGESVSVKVVTPAGTRS
jgi:beta-lactam-binding protein with PASTA domain